MYLLDTNVVSELRKSGSPRADANVITWAQGVSPGSLYLSVITIFELEVGIRLSERRDPQQGAVLRAWFEEQVLPAFNSRVFPIDMSIARRCASLHIPHPRPDRDAFIAATAITHRMIVVTRNVVDFRAMGVDAFNPWEFRINEPARAYGAAG